MKKLFSVILAVAIAVSCFAVSASAFATIEWAKNDFTYEFSADGQYVTFTYHAWCITKDAVNPFNTMDAFFKYDPTQLEYDDSDPNCKYWATGYDTSDPNSVGSLQVSEEDPDWTYFGGGITKIYRANDGDQTYSTLSWTMQVTCEPGTVIEVYDDGCGVGADGKLAFPSDCEGGFETFGLVYSIVVPEAAEEDTHTAPATPVADTKDACEACGTEAGVRFLMTVDKTAADYADVTAYGVVIETADGEYKYTVDANTKKAETDTKIEYAVVVTGAPAGTTFTATAFLVYNDNCEVAGVSGELTA